MRSFRTQLIHFNNMSMLLNETTPAIFFPSPAILELYAPLLLSEID